MTEIAEQVGSVKRANSMVKEISARSLPSFAASKRLLTDSFDTPLEAQLEKERRALALCAATSKRKEGRYLRGLDTVRTDGNGETVPGKYHIPFRVSISA